MTQELIGTKIKCLFHDDQTASLHLYENGYFCFGCGARGSLDRLGDSGLRFLGTRSTRSKRKSENVEASIKRINALPRKVIRGLELPYDSKGYYIIYPGAQYYVRRNWDDANGSKYYNPAGCGRQLLTLCYGSYAGSLGTLIVIEGQINALSACQALGVEGPLRGVVSPGAAPNFNSALLVRYCLRYSSVLIIVDKDAAGVLAGLKLQEQLYRRGLKTRVHAMKPDLNELYVNEGQAAVKTTIEENLGLLDGL